MLTPLCILSAVCRPVACPWQRPELEDHIVIERKIETEAYWRDELSITDQDMEELSFLFLETERPLTVSELAQSLVASYCQWEDDLVRRQLSVGTVYRPNGSFSVGEKLAFPHLGFALGTVVEQRDGHNREHGDFRVITVQLANEEREKTRSFAAEFKVPHKLALSQGSSWESVFALAPDDLYRRYGSVVTARLKERLLATSEFEGFRGWWLPSDMLADLHVGYLNIAEAMLDVKGEPLLPEELLVELELPDEISQPIKVFSLNRALSHDDRFDDVGDDQRVLWSLQRWEPEVVLSPPARLRYEPVVYDRTGLDVAHLQLEREIDDEASELVASPTIANARSLTLLLGYSHWRTGALPLTARTRVFFPSGNPEQHTLITFVDRLNHKEFPGWVVRGHRFVHGLEDWYSSYHIPVGAYVRLERLESSRRVAISYVPRRMQREWVRVVSTNADGELTFQMQKRPIACEYDEMCLLGEGGREVADELWQREQERNRSLDELVSAVFLELAKVSPNGMVHSKTLNNAVNVIRRCPPGLLFAALFRLPQFVTTGDGYWVFQPSGRVY